MPIKEYEDLGIYPDIPFLARTLQVIDTVIVKLFVNPIAILLWDAVWVFLGIILVGSKLLTHFGGALSKSVLVVLLIVFTLIWAFVLGKIVPLYVRLSLGRPVFGKIGGLPRKTFNAALKSASAVKFEFRADDLEKVKTFNRFDRDVTEETLKLIYRGLQEKRAGTADLPDFEERWAEVWKNKILKAGTENLTFEEGMSDENLSFRIIVTKLIGMSNVITPLIKLVQIAMIFLIVRHLNGSTPLITVVQVGFLFGSVIALLVFLHHSYHLGEIKNLGFAGGIPDKSRQKFQDRVNATALDVTPTNVTVGRRYFPVVTNYFLGASLLPGLIVNSLTVLVWVGFILLVGLVARRPDMGEILPWYKGLLLGLLCLVIGLAAAYLLTMWVIRHLKSILAPLVGALAVALLPFGLEYIFTGRLDYGKANNTIIAAVAGVGTLLSTTIASLLKKNLEEKK